MLHYHISQFPQIFTYGDREGKDDFFPAFLPCSVAQALYIEMTKDRLTREKALNFNIITMWHRKGNDDPMNGLI